LDLAASQGSQDHAMMKETLRGVIYRTRGEDCRDVRRLSSTEWLERVR
jgi:hypothetical protein